LLFFTKVDDSFRRLCSFSLLFSNGLREIRDYFASNILRDGSHYACTRKETSKAGSVLILRFFHGYYPSEITKVIRGTRHAVDLRLRNACAEAKATLANPEGWSL